MTATNRSAVDRLLGWMFRVVSAAAAPAEQRAAAATTAAANDDDGDRDSHRGSSPNARVCAGDPFLVCDK
jgi:hypothetical protein